MDDEHNIFWRLFVGRRLGRLEGLTLPGPEDREGQILFGAANFLGLLIVIMLLGTLPALYSPPALGAVLLTIALAVLLRGLIAIFYYRHLKSWGKFTLYTASVAIMLVIIGIFIFG